METLPDVLQQLIDAYVKSSDQLSSWNTSEAYWESRHDANTMQWNFAVLRAPHLAQWCPYCPLGMLMNCSGISLERTLHLISSKAQSWPKPDLQWAVRTAAEYGNVILLHWLRFCGLTKEDAQTSDNYALRWAAYNGHISILHELRMNWGLGTDDARAGQNDALRSAAFCGHVPILQELRMNWGLGTDDARANSNEALLVAIMRGKVDVVQEFRLHWSLTEADAGSFGRWKKWRS